MSKYGQEDLLNRSNRSFQSLVRLIVLSLGVGGVATLIWWRMRAPPSSFYYLFNYWYSWIYCRIPFGCSEVAIYNQQSLLPFLEQISQLIKDCGVVFSLTSFFCFIGLRYYFVQYSNNLDKKRYLRGARLLKPFELNREIDKARNTQGKLKYPSDSSDLYLGKESIRLPHSLTYRHIGVIGVPGTGKTQLIIGILKQLQVLKRHKCLILDLNGQYYQKFGRKGDKILSLQDPDSEAWSFYGENGIPPQFFAEALVEVDEKNKFFGNAGRALMTDIINRNSTIEGVYQDLLSPIDKLLEKLKGGLSPSLLGAEEQAAGVIASTVVELGFLKTLSQSTKNNKTGNFFSLTDWVLSDSQDWVFLIVRDIDLPATKPLLRLWVELVVGGILMREENISYPHIYVICDELPGLGALPSLGKLLSQGRKYKATMIAGYQVRGQIEKLYSREGAKEIVAGLQNKFIFRNPDPVDAKEECLTLGEQEVIEITSNAQLGGVGIRGSGLKGDSDSLQRNIKTRLLVLPSELQNLADMKAYVKICEFNPCLISFDYQLPSTASSDQNKVAEKQVIEKEVIEKQIAERYTAQAKPSEAMKNPKHQEKLLPLPATEEAQEKEETQTIQIAKGTKEGGSFGTLSEEDLQWDIEPDEQI